MSFNNCRKPLLITYYFQTKQNTKTGNEHDNSSYTNPKDYPCDISCGLFRVWYTRIILLHNNFLDIFGILKIGCMIHFIQIFNQNVNKRLSGLSKTLEYRQLLFCGIRALGDWGDDYLMEGLGDLKDALALFIVTARCQDRCFGVNETGADD